MLFDAVALVMSQEGVKTLLKESTARDFIADAFAHMKFIGYTQDAQLLLKKAGIADSLDEACISLAKLADAKRFLQACAALRFWKREASVNAV